MIYAIETNQGILKDILINYVRDKEIYIIAGENESNDYVEIEVEPSVENLTEIIKSVWVGDCVSSVKMEVHEIAKSKRIQAGGYAMSLIPPVENKDCMFGASIIYMHLNPAGFYHMVDWAVNAFDWKEY